MGSFLVSALSLMYGILFLWCVIDPSGVAAEAEGHFTIWLNAFA